ncbi:heterokaryon incompatibility protein [Rutstroemia sp. NJR-2017a BBW]|nr:heterokaryon incompatibility protein [Rutstroemia sp. NJR-2017a BBW]
MVFAQETCFAYLKDGFYSAIGILTHENSYAAVSQIISGRPVQPRADSEKSFRIARAWLSRCLMKDDEERSQEYHWKCDYGPETMLPNRIIDVGAESSSIPRLILSSDMQGRYLALSHCWGIQIYPFITTSKTINLRMQEIALEDPSLPKTFTDAILLTRELGFRYLWIDSLCIIQDSEDDWLHESKLMHEYYGNAVLTIAVDMASADTEGFLESPRQISNQIRATFNSTNEEQKHPIWGWTLQEQLLSPRLLQYTATQLVWECKSCEVSESNRSILEPRNPITKRIHHLPLPEEQDDDSETDDQAFNLALEGWDYLVQEYQHRALTEAMDIFPALSGIARQFHERSGFNYMAGLWLEDLHWGLLWSTEGCGRRMATYRAPSWSWASYEISNPTTPNNGKLRRWADANQGKRDILLYGSVDQRDCKCKILDCQITLKENDPYGRLTGGHLIIRARWLLLSAWRGQLPPYCYGKNVSNPRKTQLSLDLDQRCDLPEVNSQLSMVQIVRYNLDDDDDAYKYHDSTNSEGENDSNREARAIWYGLLLLPEENGSFQRVGVVEIPDVGNLASKGWVKKEVTII